MKDPGVQKSTTEGGQDVFDWRLVARNKIITTGSQSSVSALCAELSLSCATIETNITTISRILQLMCVTAGLAGWHSEKLLVLNLRIVLSS